MERSTTRADDIVARYGGEEFVVLMNGALAPATHRRTHPLGGGAALLTGE